MNDSPIGRSSDTVGSIPKAETRRNAINSTHSRNIPVTRIMIFFFFIFFLWLVGRGEGGPDTKGLGLYFLSQTGWKQVFGRLIGIEG